MWLTEVLPLPGPGNTCDMRTQLHGVRLMSPPFRGLPRSEGLSPPPRRAASRVALGGSNRTYMATICVQSRVKACDNEHSPCWALPLSQGCQPRRAGGPAASQAASTDHTVWTTLLVGPVNNASYGSGEPTTCCGRCLRGSLSNRLVRYNTLHWLISIHDHFKMGRHEYGCHSPSHGHSHPTYWSKFMSLRRRDFIVSPRPYSPWFSTRGMDGLLCSVRAVLRGELK